MTKSMDSDMICGPGKGVITTLPDHFTTVLIGGAAMPHEPMRAPKVRQDLTGLVFGKLTVLGKSNRSDDGRSFRFWHCRCECGTEKDVAGTALKACLTKTCGCGRAANFRKDGLASQHRREHAVWQAAIQRCHNPNSQGYPRYGARGIAVCDRWRSSFAAFIEDMGPRPGDDFSLDRIDNNGPYAPENCRWATRTEQGRNTRANHLIEHDGRRMTITEWSAETGVSADAIRSRIESGWTVEEAFSVPSGELVNMRRRRDDGTFLPR